MPSPNLGQKDLGTRPSCLQDFVELFFFIDLALDPAAQYKTSPGIRFTDLSRNFLVPGSGAATAVGCLALELTEKLEYR